MKHILLLFSFLFITLTVSAQMSANLTSKGVKVSIYPNPTTNHIGLNNTDNIAYIRILDLIGKEIKTFYVREGECYDVADLEYGMYLVQIVDNNNKIVMTQRLKKI